MSKLPAPLRHLVLAIASVLLGWGITDLVPFLNSHSNFGGPLAAAVVGALIAYFTPLVNSYGVGKSRINYGVSSDAPATDL